MTVELKKEKLGFQTEVKQLLHLMIHSLYSNREIFLRELISNASDAADKLRFLALSDDKLMENDSNIEIRISFDEKEKTITIEDNGIGMTREDVVTHLGTIAKSGTADFLSNLTGDQKKDSHLIGQFGVGFYSSFIVADRVAVLTRKAGTAKNEGVLWESDGSGEFTVATTEKDKHGTSITLHLKEDATEFADNWRLRNIIRKYSDHISLPVLMQKEKTPNENEEKEPTAEAEIVEETVIEWESVNTAKALWTRPKTDISDEEYKEFYKHISHDFADPLKWSHNRIEGKLEYNSLLFIPSKAPFDLYNRDMQKGLKLYIQRTFIMDQADEFLPMYLRFIKGVVDSNDLSLNISREILQKDPAVDSMKTAFTKRALDMLSKMATKEPELYTSFWKEFGQVLKEGPAEDFSNREKIAKLLRFASTESKDATQDQSLEGYVSRMKEDQEYIYYLTADSYSAAISSPHLEVFNKKNIEVLLLSDRVDEWLMSNLQAFEGKSFTDISKGDLDLGKLDDEEDKKSLEKSNKDKEDLLKRIQTTLGDKVEEVRVTHRLTDSPACLVTGKNDLGLQMRRIMEAAGQTVPSSKPIFEINSEHPLINRLDNETDEDFFADLVLVIFDQASLAAGNQIADTSNYVKRLNKLLLKIAD